MITSPPSMTSIILFLVVSVLLSCPVHASTSILIAHDGKDGGRSVDDLVAFDGSDVEKQIPIKSRESYAYLRVVREPSSDDSSSVLQLPTKLALTLFQDVPQINDDKEIKLQNDNRKKYQLKTSLGITMPSYVTDVYIQIGKIQEQISGSSPVKFIQHFSLSFLYSSKDENEQNINHNNIENLKSKTVSITTEASPVSYLDVLETHPLLSQQLKTMCEGEKHKLCKQQTISMTLSENANERIIESEVECLMSNKILISDMECLKILKIIENEAEDREVSKAWINGYQIPFHELETVTRAIISFEISVALLIFCLILLYYVSKDDIDTNDDNDDQNDKNTANKDRSLVVVAVADPNDLHQSLLKI